MVLEKFIGVYEGSSGSKGCEVGSRMGNGGV